MMMGVLNIFNSNQLKLILFIGRKYHVSQAYKNFQEAVGVQTSVMTHIKNVYVKKTGESFY